MVTMFVGGEGLYTIILGGMVSAVSKFTHMVTGISVPGKIVVRNRYFIELCE